MSYEQNRCPIWGTPSGGHNLGDNGTTIVPSSCRAYGSYRVTWEALSSVLYRDDGFKKRLTTWLVDQHIAGVHMPIVTMGVIDSAQNAQPLGVGERGKRLLAYFVRSTQSVGQPIAIALPSDDSVESSRYGTLGEVPESVCNLWRAMACSESTSIREVISLTDYLVQNGWLKRDGLMQPESVAVTVDGYASIEDSRVNVERTQAFVAMWFDDEMKEAYFEGFSPAIRDAGYTAMRIDQKEHINKIDDEIVAEIRRSRFLVADFSQGEEGARGGVYWEDGFATGLGLQVIRTCRRDCMDKVAFDIRQYNHILWESTQDLRDALRHRILEAIGEGPNLPPATT